MTITCVVAQKGVKAERGTRATVTGSGARRANMRPAGRTRHEQGRGIPQHRINIVDRPRSAATGNSFDRIVRHGRRCAPRQDFDAVGKPIGVFPGQGQRPPQPLGDNWRTAHIRGDWSGEDSRRKIGRHGLKVIKA